MGIYKFEVLNPTTDRKRPFYNKEKGLFIFPVKSKYRYFIECANINETTGQRDFYLLLSNTKFDENCRLCHTDSYGRCQVKVKGEIKDYIISETTYRGNIDIVYLESEDDYDIFKLL